MTVLYSNNAATTLAASITNAATSLSVASGAGALFPAISGSDYFYATLTNAAAAVEIVKVTGRSGDTFTVVRAQDGTSALAWSSGDKVELRITKAVLDDFKEDTVKRIPTYEKVQNIGSVSGAKSVDVSLGRVAIATVTGAVTWSFTGLRAGEINSVTLVLTNPGAGTQTFPTGTVFDKNVAPYMPPTGKAVIMLETYDDGASWTAAQVWRNVA
jgi:hypothetical protein